MTYVEYYLNTLKKSGHKALIGYITAGFPNKKGFQDTVVRLQRAGLNILEIGVPFSDPVADGVTIQRSSQIALKNGVTLPWILDSLSTLREMLIPVILMAYSNSILAMGIDHFFERARSSGVNGVIIPDLIPEEGKPFERAARREKLALIYLATPTTGPARLKQIARATTGFLYAVSLTGITGARRSLPPNTMRFLSQLRRATRKPIAIGFGISTPEQVRTLRTRVDGVIVGSALINHLGTSLESAERFVSVLQSALNPKGANHASSKRTQ